MMKYRFLVTMLLLIWQNAISQCNHVNCIIFVDGKIPDCYTIRGFFEYDNGNLNEIINFDYSIGEMNFSTESKNFIDSLNDKEDIILNLNYLDLENRQFSYRKKMKVKHLRDIFLVIRITNLNIKKEEYYFGYSTYTHFDPLIKKEYNMFD